MRVQDEDEKDDARFLSQIRQVVGGLLLPSISVSIEKLILRHILPLDNYNGSAIIRTIIVNAFLRIILN